MATELVMVIHFDADVKHDVPAETHNVPDVNDAPNETVTFCVPLPDVTDISPVVVQL